MEGGWRTALAQAEALSGLSAFSVIGGGWFRDQEAETLASTAHFSSLRVLRLHHTGIGRAGVRALAESPYLKDLDFLSLVAAPVGPIGATALARSANLSRLTFLDLWCADISDEGVRALAQSPHLGRLQTLLLDDNDIGPDAVAALAGSPFLKSLSALNLARNQCGPVGPISLTGSPLLSRLRALDLGWTTPEGGDDAVEVLAADPRTAGLRILGLAGNDLTDRAATALTASPHLSNLWRLSLYSHAFTGVADHALADHFGDRVVRTRAELDQSLADFLGDTP